VSKKTIIAIAGPSASGKSLFASTVYQELLAELGGECIAILAEDAYYRDQSHLSFGTAHTHQLRSPLGV
jgi:uridine kinase